MPEGASLAAVVIFGAFPLPSHAALRMTRPRLFAAGVSFSAYSLASMPVRELDAVAVDAPR